MEIQGYPNYLIYEDGRIWSNYNKGRWLKPQFNAYFRISLFKDGKRKFFLIHRLVAIHFIPNPENKPCVDHIDGITTNNNVSNLRWVTQKENNQNSLKAKGVSFDKKCTYKPWIARWCLDGKNKSKCFSTEKEALQHRKNMVDLHYNRPKI